MFFIFLYFLLLAIIIGTLSAVAVYWLKWILPPLFGGGAPFVATEPETVELMIKLAQITPVDRVCDLGSGDGRIVIAAAQAGAQTAVGYEVQLPLVVLSRANAEAENLADKTDFKHESMWKADVSSFDVIFLYQISYAMQRLSKKLKSELPVGARIISSGFAFPDWEPVAQQENVRVYIKT